MEKLRFLVSVIILMASFNLAIKADENNTAMKETQSKIGAHLNQVIQSEMANLKAMECAMEDKECLAKELQERYRLDQWMRADFDELSICGEYAKTHEQLCRQMFMGSMVFQIDLPNASRLKEIMKTYGFPSGPDFSKETQIAAWYIVQHAQFIGKAGSTVWDADLAESILPDVKQGIKEGSLTPWHFAAMYDRIALTRGNAQRYATQYQCNGDKASFKNLEDESRVTEFRTEIGMKAFDQSVYDQQCSSS